MKNDLEKFGKTGNYESKIGGDKTDELEELKKRLEKKGGSVAENTVGAEENKDQPLKKETAEKGPVAFEFSQSFSEAYLNGKRAKKLEDAKKRMEIWKKKIAGEIEKAEASEGGIDLDKIVKSVLKRSQPALKLYEENLKQETEPEEPEEPEELEEKEEKKEKEPEISVAKNDNSNEKGNNQEKEPEKYATFKEVIDKYGNIFRVNYFDKNRKWMSIRQYDDKNGTFEIFFGDSGKPGKPETKSISDLDELFATYDTKERSRYKSPDKKESLPKGINRKERMALEGVLDMIATLKKARVIRIERGERIGNPKITVEKSDMKGLGIASRRKIKEALVEANQEIDFALRRPSKKSESDKPVKSEEESEKPAKSEEAINDTGKQFPEDGSDQEKEVEFEKAHRELYERITSEFKEIGNDALEAIQTKMIDLSGSNESTDKKNEKLKSFEDDFNEYLAKKGKLEQEAIDSNKEEDEQKEAEFEKKYDDLYSEIESEMGGLIAGTDEYKELGEIQADLINLSDGDLHIVAKIQELEFHNGKFENYLSKKKDVAKDIEQELAKLDDDLMEKRKKYVELMSERDKNLSVFSAMFRKVDMGEFNKEYENAKNDYGESIGKYKDYLLEDMEDDMDAEIMTDWLQRTEYLNIENIKAETELKDKKWPEKLKDNYSRVIDRYRKLPFKKKILIGLGLAGIGLASSAVGGAVATGGMITVGAMRIFSISASSFGFKQMFEATAKKSRDEKDKREVQKAIKGSEREGEIHRETFDKDLKDKIQNIDGTIEKRKQWKKYRTWMAVGSGVALSVLGRYVGSEVKEYFQGGETVAVEDAAPVPEEMPDGPGPDTETPEASEESGKIELKNEDGSIKRGSHGISGTMEESGGINDNHAITSGHQQRAEYFGKELGGDEEIIAEIKPAELTVRQGSSLEGTIINHLKINPDLIDKYNQLNGSRSFDAGQIAHRMALDWAENNSDKFPDGPPSLIHPGTEIEINLKDMSISEINDSEGLGYLPEKEVTIENPQNPQNPPEVPDEALVDAILSEDLAEVPEGPVELSMEEKIANESRIMKAIGINGREYEKIKGVKVGELLEKITSRKEVWAAVHAEGGSYPDLPHDGVYGLGELKTHMRLSEYVGELNPSEEMKNMTIEDFLRQQQYPETAILRAIEMNGDEYTAIQEVKLLKLLEELPEGKSVAELTREGAPNIDLPSDGVRGGWELGRQVKLAEYIRSHNLTEDQINNLNIREFLTGVDSDFVSESGSVEDIQGDTGGESGNDAGTVDRKWQETNFAEKTEPEGFGVRTGEPLSPDIESIETHETDVAHLDEAKKIADNWIEKDVKEDSLKEFINKPTVSGQTYFLKTESGKFIEVASDIKTKMAAMNALDKINMMVESV